MLTKIKVYMCYAVKIYKKQTQQIFERDGARPLCRCRIIFVPGKNRSGRKVRIKIFVPVYTVIFVPATVQCVLNF